MPGISTGPPNTSPSNTPADQLVPACHQLAAVTAQASATVNQVVGADTGRETVIEAMPAKNSKGITHQARQFRLDAWAYRDTW